MASLIGSGTVSNPMTSDLLANGFNITGAATYSGVRAEAQTLAVPAGSGLTEVVCEDNLLIEGGQALLFGAPAVGTASIKIEGDPGRDVILGPIPAGSVANVIGYDTATNKLYYQAASGGVPLNITVSSIQGANSINMTTQSNGNIWLQPNGTGNVLIESALDMRSNVIYDINALTGQAGGLIDFTTLPSTMIVSGQTGCDVLVRGGDNVTSAPLTLTGSRVNVSTCDLFLNGNDIQEASTVYAGFINANTAISSDLTINAIGGSVLIEDISVSGTSITAPAANADITFNMNGTGSLLVNNTGAVGATDPLFAITNTNTTGASANPVKMLMYKNDSNTTASDLIGDITCRANAGGVGAQVGYDYTSIRSVVRGATTAGNIDGSLQFLVAENATTPAPGTLTNYLELNGGNANVRINKPVDMNAQNITNVNAIALGSLTNVGLLGYNITSRGSGNNSLWQQSRQSLIANYGGGSSINDTTPTNFGVSLPTISFPLSATGRYKVTVSIGFDLGSSADLLIYPEVQYNAGTYAGAIYAPPVYVVAPHVNKAGAIHNSASFVDYFTVPITLTSTFFSVDVNVLTVSGTTSTNNVRTYITVEPDFA